MEYFDTQDEAQKIILRLRGMQDVRRDYENLWYDICRFVNPRRENIKQSDYTKQKGQRRGKDCYDGTPLGALNTWADGMQGFLVSESLNWFRSEMDNPYLNTIDEVTEWLQEYDRIMYEAFRRSNFYSTIPMWLRDAGSIGTAPLYGEEDIAGGKSVFTAIHPREVYISEDKYGEVDTVFREFEFTARQAIEKFGEEKFDESFVSAAKTAPEKRHLFIHAVYPNDDVLFGSNGTKGKKLKSIYVRVEGDVVSGKGKIVKESGYKINPYAVWRFRKNSDEAYGYSPAADSLVETFGLNQFAKTLTQAAQISVDPALNVPSEQRGNEKILPHGYNYYEDPTRVITPVYSGINYPVGDKERERLINSLRDKYRVDFFQMLTRSGVGRERTAEEIIEMKSEQAQLMGPQVDSLYREGLSKVFDIMHDIEDRNRRLPPAPDVVYQYGGNIHINLTGPLAQQQKRSFRIRPIQDGLASLAPIAQIFPNVLDRIDEDEMAEEILEASGFFQRLIRTDDEVNEIRAARAEKEQAMAALQIAGGAAEAVPKLSKAVEPNSVMETLMKGKK